MASIWRTAMYQNCTPRVVLAEPRWTGTVSASREPMAIAASKSVKFNASQTLKDALDG